jgi:predicted CopG family antitoxin
LLIKKPLLCNLIAPSATNVCVSNLDFNTQSMHDLCMATKTISIEIDAYELLVRERKDPKESFSRVIRRVLSERPALTAGDLLDAMKAFEGRGAGPRRRRSRDAAA